MPGFDGYLQQDPMFIGDEIPQKSLKKGVRALAFLAPVFSANAESDVSVRNCSTGHAGDAR